MLLRASELTLQNGFDKFLVEQREVKTYQQLASGGASMSYTTQSRPNAFMIIRMLKSDDPRAKTALDAATVDAELRSR